MQLRVDVTAKDTASPSVAAMIEGLTGETAAELNAVAARTATLSAADYHRAFDARGGWENRRLPTHGPGRDSSGFGADVAESWHFRGADAAGATIANDGPYIRHKVKGGTITAKRVRFLTIPQVPEAHGRSAAQFADDFGVKLFAAKGALFAPGKAKGEAPRRIYSLVRSVTQGPWPGALPPDEDLVAAYANGWRTELDRRIP